MASAFLERILFLWPFMAPSLFSFKHQDQFYPSSIKYTTRVRQNRLKVTQQKSRTHSHGRFDSSRRHSLQRKDFHQALVFAEVKSAYFLRKIALWPLKIVLNGALG